MSFTLRYKPVRLRSGNVIYRPLIPVILEGKEKIDVLAVLDSGSAMSILPAEIAEVLGLNYSGENELSGISGLPLKAKETKRRITFGKGRDI